MTPTPDPVCPAGEAELRWELPAALRAELMPEAENLAAALTEAVLADGLGFKGPFEEFGRIAEPLLLDALGAARRDGAQIANAGAEARVAQITAECDRLQAKLDEALRLDAPERTLDPQWGMDAFRAILGERYTPRTWGKHRALHHSSLKFVMAAEGLPDEVYDVVAALIWDCGITGNRAQFAFDELFNVRSLLVAAEAERARLAAENAGQAQRVTVALDDACRMSTIRLKVGDLSSQEQQLASIVAGLIRGAVRAALAAQPKTEESRALEQPSTGGEEDV